MSEVLDAPGLDEQLPAPPTIARLRQVPINPDHWHPLAWSRELVAGRAHAASFAGEPIVLVRSKQGDVFALEDRCAHRQVPLSAGVVSERGLRCGYHGWTYDRTGDCIEVPYLGKGKLPNGVRAYPCREQDGLVFVFPGDPAKAATTSFPELGSAGDPAYRTRRFGHDVACHYSFMHENLMDMNHQFLHRKQMGEIKPRFRGRRSGAGWIEADYTFAREGGRQSWGERAIFGARKGGEVQHGALMRIRTQYPYQRLKIWAGGEDTVMDLWITYVPLDAAQRTNRTFGLMSIRKPKKFAALLGAAWPFVVWFTDRIFTEDRHIVEREQAAHDAQGENRNQEVFPVIRDLGALLAREGLAPGSWHPAARPSGAPCALACA